MKPYRKSLGIWGPDKRLTDNRGFISPGIVGAVAGSRRRTGGGGGGSIAFDAATNGQSSGDSWSHTATGSNVVLIVQVLGNSAVTSVVYDPGGAAISLTAGGTTNTFAGYTLRYYWGALGTGAGTAKTITVTGGGDKYCTSASYTGCAQTGQFDSMAASKTTTTSADNSWHLCCFWKYSGDDPTYSGGWVSRAQSNRLATVRHTDGAAAVTPAGSSTAGLTTTGGIIYLSASIKPA